MPQTCFPNDHGLYWILLISLAACLTIQATGCQMSSGSGPPDGSPELTATCSAASSRASEPAAAELAAPDDCMTEKTQATEKAAAATTPGFSAVPASESTSRTADEPKPVSLLIGLDLPACQQLLLKQAEKMGFTAALVQPDRTRPSVFLILAENRAAAEQLNGFFYWLADPAAGSASDQLVLSLDRLFAENGREAAIAGGLYRESAIVGLLDQSLRLILKDQYQPDVLTYILENYRADYRRRLTEPGTRTWTRRQTFRTLEVTYEASIYSCVLFECRMA